MHAVALLAAVHERSGPSERGRGAQIDKKDKQNSHFAQVKNFCYRIFPEQEEEVDFR